MQLGIGEKSRSLETLNFVRVAVVSGGGWRLLRTLSHSGYIRHAVLKQSVRGGQPEHPRTARIQNTQQFRRLSPKGNNFTLYSTPCIAILIKMKKLQKRG
jgi:hypothetical protein